MSASLKDYNLDNYSHPAPLLCAQCKIFNLCSSGSLAKTKKAIKSGDYLFKEHRPFQALFTVLSGAIKTYSENSNGEVQITGIYLAGDIIGLDSTNTDTYNSSAKALIQTSVCSIPFKDLEVLAAKNPLLQHYFFALMSEEIKRSQIHTYLVSKKSSEGRMASMLMDFSKRFHQQNDPEASFRIPISRIDIGNYLGLAVETVSRVLTRFQNSGLIFLHGREVIIKNSLKLTEIAKHNL